MVKHYMQTGNVEGILQKDLFGNIIRPFEPVTRKPMRNPGRSGRQSKSKECQVPDSRTKRTIINAHEKDRGQYRGSGLEGRQIETI